MNSADPEHSTLPQPSDGWAYLAAGKSVVDRTVAGVALLVLSPVLSALALLVRQRLGSPVLSAKSELGGRTFTVSQSLPLLPCKPSP